MYLVTDKHEHDVISCPSHYDLAGANIHLEPIDLVKELDFLLGNACKYLFRFKLKGHPLEDLDKAYQYLNWFRANGCQVKWNTHIVQVLAHEFLLNKKHYHPALVHILTWLAYGSKEMGNEIDNAIRALDED